MADIWCLPEMEGSPGNPDNSTKTRQVRRSIDNQENFAHSFLAGGLFACIYFLVSRASEFAWATNTRGSGVLLVLGFCMFLKGLSPPDVALALLDIVPEQLS